VARHWGLTHSSHRFTSSAREFGKVDHWLLQGIWRWIKRQHKGKRLRKHLAKYFAQGLWKHSAWTTDGSRKLIELVRLNALELRRHIKIRGAAHPYDPHYADYFRLRRELGTSRPARA
jgi:RNA-directed DNA polymerase